MNFRRILSKSSLKSNSSASNPKSLISSEEVQKLQSEVQLLKQTIESLKVSVESRDAAIGTLAREKEKLYVELRSAQRTNRNLHQQLVDERDMHTKEKDFLAEEIKRMTKRNWNIASESHTEQHIIATSSESATKQELKEKDEVIYNLCVKYLKIKSSKERYKKKLEKVWKHSQQVCENVIFLLDENRQNVDSILRKLLKSSLVIPSHKSYLNLLKMNANLQYENTHLKICHSIKEFSKNCEEKSLRKKTIGKKAKSQPGMTRNTSSTSVPSYKASHYVQTRRRFYKIQSLEKLRCFSNIHSLFAPYFRRKRIYSSEPILANFANREVNKDK